MLKSEELQMDRDCITTRCIGTSLYAHGAYHTRLSLSDVTLLPGFRNGYHNQHRIRVFDPFSNSCCMKLRI